FDSEGSVDEDGDVKVYNTDLGLLRYVKQLLKTLGIETTGPHLYLKSGTTFRDPRNGKTYKRKKDNLCYCWLSVDILQADRIHNREKEAKTGELPHKDWTAKTPSQPPIFPQQCYHTQTTTP
ncbi:MAG: LAGLIDADG family homing endonuclease, partial [Nitrososphaerota archaeon]